MLQSTQAIQTVRMPTLRQHFHPMAEPEALLIWYQARDQLTTRARDAGKAIHSINICPSGTIIAALRGTTTTIILGRVRKPQPSI